MNKEISTYNFCRRTGIKPDARDDIMANNFRKYFVGHVVPDYWDGLMKVFMMAYNISPRRPGMVIRYGH